MPILHVAVPLSLWPEISSLPDSELRELNAEFESLTSRGITPREIEQRMVELKWTPEFAAWYCSHLDRPPAPEIIFHAPPGPPSDELFRRRNALNNRALIALIGGVILDLVVGYLFLSASAIPRQTLGAALVAIGGLYVYAGALFAKTKGQPAYYGILALACCKAFGFLIILFIPDIRPLREFRPPNP